MYEYRLRQEGLTVAQVSGNSDDQAQAEMMRYFHQYLEDGPTVVEKKTPKGRWKFFLEGSSNA